MSCKPCCYSAGHWLRKQDEGGVRYAPDSDKFDPPYRHLGTGTLTNPNEVQHGYQDKSKTLREADVDGFGKLGWNFVAHDVHDFTWAADPDYEHYIYQAKNGDLTLRFLHKPFDSPYNKVWEKARVITAEIFQFLEENVGRYPFSTYSVIQGGDGGMEYAQCTLIIGNA